MLEGVFAILNTETTALIELTSCVAFMLMLLRYFGIYGLYVYITVISIVANIQNLRVVNYLLMADPMVLGTITFSTIFIASNLMTEYYGPVAARRGVLVSLVGYGMFSFLMLTTNCYPVGQNVPSGVLDMCIELKQVFTPVPYLFVASVLAFVIAQYTNVAIYAAVKRITSARFMWVRSFISLTMSTFIDGVVYATLAWKVFYALPIGWGTLFKTYVLSNYVLSVLILWCSSPVVCLAKKFVPESK
ncbi:MAG: queuosine precursor transporter [Holosporales bacterium]|jgi:uncharacterized integral membrane protein (TIGR00697 family)|nr:queuosine precursor transporter [Holosporales bacterium]